MLDTENGGRIPRPWDLPWEGPQCGCVCCCCKYEDPLYETFDRDFEGDAAPFRSFDDGLNAADVFECC